MPTIDELLDPNKLPQEHKTAQEHWEEGSWFQPFYKAVNNNGEIDWFGKHSSGDSLSFSYDGKAWQLYTKPKKKKKLYMWAVKEGDSWCCHEFLYEDL